MPKFVSFPRPVERVFDGALQRALTLQEGRVADYVERLRRQRPYAPPAEILRLLEGRYVAGAMAVGAGAGAVSALPTVGTVAGLAGAAAEITAFVEATALFALAAAEVHGVELQQPEQRRALVVALLVGDAAVAGLQRGGARRGSRWSDVVTRRLNAQGAKGVNRRLARHAVVTMSRRQGALLLGRALPFGIGMGIGAVGNRMLAREAVRTSRQVFGPPPRQFGPAAAITG